MERSGCQVHKLVADVCLFAEDRVLLARYQDTSGYDGQEGWFLPDDYLRHGEHPDAAASRILADQAGLDVGPLGLSHIESFEGHGAWHLIFHYTRVLRSAPGLAPGRNVKSLEWFPLANLPDADQVAHGGWALEIIRSVQGGG